MNNKSFNIVKIVILFISKLRIKNIINKHPHPHRHVMCSISCDVCNQQSKHILNIFTSPQFTEYWLCSKCNFKYCDILQTKIDNIYWKNIQTSQCLINKKTNKLANTINWKVPRSSGIIDDGWSSYDNQHGLNISISNYNEHRNTICIYLTKLINNQVYFKNIPIYYLSIYNPDFHGYELNLFKYKFDKEKKNIWMKSWNFQKQAYQRQIVMILLLECADVVSIIFEYDGKF